MEENHDQSSVLSIGMLPPEVLTQVFSNFNPCDLGNALTVNKNWYNIINGTSNLWRNQCAKLPHQADVMLDRAMGLSWKEVFQRSYGKNGITRQWKKGCYSNCRTYRELPSKVMCSLDADDWGDIFEMELGR